MKSQQSFIWLLIAIVIFASACSFRKDKSQQPVPQQEKSQQKKEEQIEQPSDEDSDKNIVPDSERDKAVEENINAEDLDEDIQFTRVAQKDNGTLGESGISQQEVDQARKDTDEEDTIKVTRQFNTQLPEGMEMGLKYDRYPISFDYFLVTDEPVNVRKTPSMDAPVVCKATYGQKMALYKEVEGDMPANKNSNIWYKVSCKHQDEIITGYIYSALGEPRVFQFQSMLEHLNVLKQEVDNNNTAFINNYKNYHGLPPLYNGQSVDKYGYRQSQSAAGYLQPDVSSEFRYFPDGTLCSILGESSGFIKIRAIGHDGEYWVQKKYINQEIAMPELTKVVVIDRRFQNQGSFEYVNGRWVLVSYTFSTTGKQGPNSLETPLGNYMVIQIRDKLFYLGDETTEIVGYAPHAIRFSAGGYIHGVPVQYVEQNGEKVDPGQQEYLQTIGTVPRSHMCVRNYTSHAEFLSNWLEIGKSAVIVIE
ncbi:MAG: SH3 domain-containing protein [Clostridia bacterium]|nr:SH3 domain-containing protein [Clostridia bacterium]